MKTQVGWEGGILRFYPYFDIRHNQDGRVVGCRRRPHYIPKKISWYSFLLEAERTPGLLNADRRRRLSENFQGPYRESNPDPPVLCEVLKLTVPIDSGNVL
jgi:hypothetical protein